MPDTAVDGAEAITVHDTNYAGRLGWKEIVVGASTRSLSDELHAYPKSLLQSPLDVTHVRATISPTDAAVPQLSTGRSLEAPDRVADSGFTKLIGERHLSALVILVSLAAALFWAILACTGGLRGLRRLPGRDLGIALALGAIGYCVQTGAYFAALERIDASLLGLLVYTFPVIVTVAA